MLLSPYATEMLLDFSEFGFFRPPHDHFCFTISCWYFALYLHESSKSAQRLQNENLL